jgi:chromatin modification-related protein EAF6
MAENIPPTKAVPNGAATGLDQNPNRGIPYYEKLRRELRDTLQKKRLMDKNMVGRALNPASPMATRNGS